MQALFVSGLSFGLSLFLYPLFINYLNKRQHQQIVSEFSLESFKAKAKTPSLGGVLFVLIPVISLVVLYPKSLLDTRIVLVLLVYCAYGLIGFIDDYKIILERNNKGLSARVKFMMQLVLAIIFYFIFRQELSSSIDLPFTDLNIDLGVLYALFVLFIFTGSSNAVNLTDGMDGLAGGTSLIALIPFAVFAYLQNEVYVFAFICALMASLIAYLWFNKHPAKIIMGDTGALALGAVLAAIALVLKQEFSFVFIMAVFIYETLCVMIQIGSVKLFKKRVFRYTPIHYSYTLSGWKETNVVYFFWFLGFVSMIIGLWLGVNL
ncbi:MAG: phospho-N-acetylmuramoyl-pentapeptide-transferase [Erysipelotrichaceae bacterium]|jgi:phospho-N-acetylmuramoyl-pentapeptide-transferase